MRFLKSIAVLAIGLGALNAVSTTALGQTGGSGPSAEASKIPLDQQPTKEQLTKLFEVMRLRQQMQGFMAMMPNMVKQQMQEQMKQAQEMAPNKLTAEQQEQMQKLMEKFVQKSLDLYPVDEMLADIQSVYQRHVTRTDVDAFIAFYQTPAGQHLLDEQPAIMQEYMSGAMQRVQGRTREMTAELMKEMAEITKSAAPAK